MSVDQDRPLNELELFVVEWARGASFEEIACALESGRRVDGDEAVTALFARLARLRSEGDDDAYVAAMVELVKSDTGMARLSAAYNRIEAAQRTLRQRQGKGWDGADEDAAE